MRRIKKEKENENVTSQERQASPQESRRKVSQANKDKPKPVALCIIDLDLLLTHYLILSCMYMQQSQRILTGVNSHQISFASCLTHTNNIIQPQEEPIFAKSSVFSLYISRIITGVLDYRIHRLGPNEFSFASRWARISIVYSHAKYWQ